MTDAIAVPGLTAPAEILVDRWGIPHLTAASLDDLFFLQGFNAARDRLWQIDLWRKRGLGLLAADFGPGYLAQDIASRHFLYRGDMAAEWAAYAEDAEAICTRFAAGINAYVGLTEREPERLPQEFRLFGTRPARWRPEDVVRIRSHGLTRNALSELARAHVLAGADAATDRLRKAIEPPVEVGPVPGFDPEAVPPDALQLFRLAMAPVTFPPERLAATLDEAHLWRVATDLGEVLRAQEHEGSNNWAVHGSRTATGRPILATDPHRTHAVPSLRYLVHLTAPGFDAIGAGEPSRARHHDGPQRHRRLQPDHLRRRPGGCVSLRDQPGRPGLLSLRRGLGADADGRGALRGQGRAGAAADPALHPARAGGPCRSGSAQRGGGTVGLVRAGLGRLSRQPVRHAQPQSRRVPDGDAALGHALGEPGLCRHDRHHRLAAGRPCAAAAELARPGAGAGRRQP